MRWRRVNGFAAYEISDCGLVRNAETGLVLKPEAGRRGHLRVTLYRGCRPQRFLVHRLVLEHFVGPAPEGKDDCAHWDGEPANNRLTNLRWATPQENADDRRRHGRNLYGEKNHSAKLDAVQVGVIRGRLERGASPRQMAGELGVTEGAIRRVANGDTWRHLPGARTKRERPKVNEVAAAEAIEIVANGASILHASRATGVSRQSIRRRLVQAGHP